MVGQDDKPDRLGLDSWAETLCSAKRIENPVGSLGQRDRREGSSPRTKGVPVLDVRFATRMAVRALRAAPAVTVLAVLSIGLGIGAVTTVYSTASAFTFHPLPQLADPDRLVFVGDGPAQAPIRENNVAPAT
jgi:hypothetical protein